MSELLRRCTCGHSGTFGGGEHGPSCALSARPTQPSGVTEADRTAWLIEMNMDCLSRGSIGYFGIHYWHPTQGFHPDIDEALQFARKQDAEAFKREFKLNGRVTEHLWPAMRSAAPTSGEVERIRPEVRAFAVLMERKLRENDHKPGWKDDDVTAITKRVREEAGELDRAVTDLTKQIVWRDAQYPGEKGNGWGRQLPGGQKQIGVGYREMEGEDRERQLEAVALEAADVANMAMMVADICGQLPSVPSLATASPQGAGEHD